MLTVPGIARGVAVASALMLIPTLTTSTPTWATPDEPTTAQVTAAVETPALFDDDAGSNADADDPAIWVHPSDPSRSLVIATAKDAGLRVYDLSGNEVQAISAPPAPKDAGSVSAAASAAASALKKKKAKPGRFNNVDLALGVRWGGERADLAVVSDRGRDHLRIYRIDPAALERGAAPLQDVTAPDVPFAFSADQDEVNDQTTAYGVATYVVGGTAYAVASRRSTTELGLFKLVAKEGTVTYKRVDSLRLPASFRLPGGTTWKPCDKPGIDPQVEGMVVDVAAEALYVAQEDVGLWRIKLDAEDGELGKARLLDRVREFGVPGEFDPETEECTLDWSRDPGQGGKRISADVEGLTIYRGRGRDGYLLVSSQGDSRFLVYDRRTNVFRGRFAVADGPATDGVQHSDGAAVVNVPVGAEFPAGMLVVHDGDNTPEVTDDTGSPRSNTNMKYIDWRTVACALELSMK